MADDPPTPPPPDPLFSETVRELLGEVVGTRIIGLGQHDKEEFDDDLVGMRVELQLDSGALLILMSLTGDVRLERPDGTSITIGPIIDDAGLGE